MRKYRNNKVTLDGHTFDSSKEAMRYQELMWLVRCGEIRNLELQKKYQLIPAIYASNGKVKQRAAHYIADFVYEERTKDGEWREVVEDVKSPITKTQVYKLKKKIMLWQYGIEIKEVEYVSKADKTRR